MFNLSLFAEDDPFLKIGGGFSDFDNVLKEFVRNDIKNRTQK
jgi:hypothetical protein